MLCWVVVDARLGLLMTVSHLIFYLIFLVLPKELYVPLLSFFQVSAVSPLAFLLRLICLVDYRHSECGDVQLKFK